MHLFAQRALLEGQWARNVRIEISNGKIAAIAPGVRALPGDDTHAVLIAGMPNLHSHAFQRAMAGLAEVRGPSADSFWIWRKVMYQVALAMTADQMEAVAAQLYMEMLEAGFTRVGEFHYLHHDRDGAPYGDIGEHAARIAAASVSAGINLTLLPVFYAHSGFGGAAPIEGQRRFINSLDGFAALMDSSSRIVDQLQGGRLGLALHSLRAVAPDEVQALLATFGQGPVHIHVAEQLKEVDDCIAWSGVRPVEWLLANSPVDDRWCLIHATHMTDDETACLAARGAIAGLCPITEANLGDGVFPASSFLEAGGRFGIGSDSNISISVAHELRQLEYSQRLVRRARNVIADAGQSTGRKLFDRALSGGAAALGAKGGLNVGADADLVSLNVDAVFAKNDDQVLDHWIFADGVTVDCVWAGGAKRVAGGRHVERAHIQARFRATMRDLIDSWI
ncbi:formimidoylglutamate deiminase [Jiella sp. MQZ9-1]|uniref:Formimidoylglutamate deiminase n=1 Tax=Jiella flava TaxID=2816857 RepID=A0A939JVS3_9HYPH|nr:formimidoylglutamate deiminase [Jiella flava]MBO0662287.1 formimidoylglutamate deiminase [Jiella flava]MCD2470882.1 formimidoylglutamate deiminase [Jiella flava]